MFVGGGSKPPPYSIKASPVLEKIHARGQAWTPVPTIGRGDAQFARQIDCELRNGATVPHKRAQQIMRKRRRIDAPAILLCTPHDLHSAAKWENPYTKNLTAYGVKVSALKIFRPLREIPFRQQRTAPLACASHIFRAV